MELNQESNFSEPHTSVSTKSAKLLSVSLIGLVALMIGFIAGYFLAGSRSKALPSINQPVAQITPTITPPQDEVLYKSDWATISWRNINYDKHSADLYFTYLDTSGTHSQIFMPHVSLENEPTNVMYNGTRFIFELSGLGDGIAYFVSNARPPFDVKALKVPYDYSQQMYSNVIGWVDDKTFIYKKFSGFDPQTQTITYWIAPIDNVENARQVSLE